MLVFSETAKCLCKCWMEYGKYFKRYRDTS